MTEREIFVAAAQIESPEERAAFLDKACGNDAALRNRLSGLLAEQDQLGSFLNVPTGAIPTVDQSPAEKVGVKIGPYKLLQKLGEGGMGAVYLAEQHEPVKRQVALKIIKAGMDTSQVIARFEQERQALAMMDHPNIAKVLDAGTVGETKDEGGRMKDEGRSDGSAVSSFSPHPSSFSHGRPYFVMELVKGIPITRYCDQEHLSPNERLELFIPVCQAVQHAHQKGIIHRDLKPSNVLIALYDGRPVPKIIDFGVAKATSQKLTERTLFTEVGSIVGTLEYMAPEQAELNNLDIDTRADIYSLGVLLYELLTGATPFSSQQLRAAGFQEMMRMIKEVEPPKPSTKLSTSAELPSIAANRKLEPVRLTKLVRGDLDWIVMKCLEKERNRRYETANAFALDIQRYLHDEPVLAGPPSAAYRFKKFLRRNKGPALAAAVLLMTLLGGIIGTTWGLIRAENSRRAEVGQRKLAEESRRAESEQRKLAEAAEDTAKANERQAAAERDRAEQEKRTARAVIDFLQNRLLAQVNPENQADALLEAGRSADDIMPNPTIRELVVRAAAELTPERIETQFPNLPLVQAEILRTIGHCYMSLGDYIAGIAHQERSRDLYIKHLGIDHPKTQETLKRLGFTYMRARMFPQAIQSLQQLHQHQVSTLGPDHPDAMSTLWTLGNTYRDNGQNKEAIPLFEQLREKQIAILGPDHLDTLATINNLGAAYGASGRALESIPLVEHVRDRRILLLGPDHPKTLWSQRFVAVAYQQAGKLAEAIQIAEPLRDKAIAKLGPDNLLANYTTSQLASLYQATGRTPEALQLLQQAYEQQLARLGPDHLTTLSSQHRLAVAYFNARKYAEAAPLAAHLREQWTNKLGPDHLDTLTATQDLAWSYQYLGRSKEAIELFEQAIGQIIAKFGPNQALLRSSFNGLGQAYRSLGQWNEAIRCFERQRNFNTAHYGPKHSTTLFALSNLAGAYASGGRLPDALRVFEELVPTARTALGPTHSSTILYTNNWSDALEQAGQHSRAAEIRRELVDILRQQTPAKDPRLADALINLGQSLTKAEQFADAEPVLRECLTIREEALPDSYLTFNAKSWLGRSLWGQKKFTDAEPLLIAAYDGLKAGDQRHPPVAKAHLTNALQHLIDLYTAWDKPDEAVKWQAQLGQTRSNKQPSADSAERANP